MMRDISLHYISITNVLIVEDVNWIKEKEKENVHYNLGKLRTLFARKLSPMPHYEIRKVAHMCFCIIILP